MYAVTFIQLMFLRLTNDKSGAVATEYVTKRLESQMNWGRLLDLGAGKLSCCNCSDTRP